MFGFKSAILLLAMAGYQYAAAQEPVYNLFFNGGATLSLAGPLAVRGTATLPGSIDQCYAHCSSFADCLGFLADTNPVGAPNQVYCVALKYEVGGFTSIAAGYEFLGWRFNTPSGPSCAIDRDAHPLVNGACTCGSGAPQDTSFGCGVRVAPSQAARRKMLARSKIMPGEAPKPKF